MAKRKAKKPYKWLYEPEFNYILSLKGSVKGNATAAASRTGRSATTVSKIWNTGNWEAYCLTLKTGKNRLAREKSTTKKQPVQIEPVIKMDVSPFLDKVDGIHKHLGRLEGKANGIKDMIDSLGGHIKRVHGMVNDSIIPTLNQKEDFDAVKSMLRTLMVIAWAIFAIVATLLFIVIMALYV